MRFLDAQTNALLQVGWFRWIDVVFLVLGTTLAIVGGIHLCWYHGGMMWAILYMVAEILWLTIWKTLLAYRISFFILQTRADINLMPEAAARMAMRFQKHP